MKIGIFTECYAPVMNGVVVSIQTFKKALEDRGHEVFVFAPENKNATVEHRVYRFPSIEDSKQRLYPVMLPSINILKTYVPVEIVKELDVIHAQHMFTAGRLARLVAKEYNKPLVYTYHTLIEDYVHYSGILAPITKRYLNNMSKRFCNTCDQVITPSNPIKKKLRHYGVHKPIEVIMTGIVPENYKRYDSQALKKKYDIPQNYKILLYLSRIAKEKNLKLLLKSFVGIKKEYPACHLLMVGGGPELEETKREAEKLGIGKEVTFTGMVPKEDANKIFGMSDLFVFPSFTETQGIVIAEAMASGTPPIAVNKLGPTDLIHDGEDGFLTKLTVSDFSDKILKLLKDEKLSEKFAQKGILRVGDFSIDNSCNNLIELYNKVVKAYKK